MVPRAVEWKGAKNFWTKSRLTGHVLPIATGSEGAKRRKVLKRPSLLRLLLQTDLLNKLLKRGIAVRGLGRADGVGETNLAVAADGQLRGVGRWPRGGRGSRSELANADSPSPSAASVKQARAVPKASPNQPFQAPCEF